VGLKGGCNSGVSIYTCKYNPFTTRRGNENLDKKTMNEDGSSYIPNIHRHMSRTMVPNGRACVVP
jgi:hypothetical protein